MDISRNRSLETPKRRFRERIVDKSLNQSIKSVAISEISQVFNAHFNNGSEALDRSELQSVRSPSNYGQITNSAGATNSGPHGDQDEEDANAIRNAEMTSGGASSKDTSSMIFHQGTVLPAGNAATATFDQAQAHGGSGTTPHQSFRRKKGPAVDQPNQSRNPNLERPEDMRSDKGEQLLDDSAQTYTFARG